MRILFSSLLLSLTALSAHAADDVMVVFDGSNSMWGQIDGTAKIEIARDAIGNLTAELDTDTNVGLMAYGHRRRGDCGDIEVILPPAPLDRAAFLDHVARITPTGKTPLTDAVEQAAEALSFRDRPATVLLISDGLESCDRDPCALAATLARTGVSFTAHVVGFGLGAGADTASLACIAKETGGKFLAADDAATLGAALSTVGAEVAQAPPEPEPEPESEPGPQIEISAPQSVTQGAEFALSWAPVGDNPRDYVSIVPMGADDDASGAYVRVSDRSSGTLVAPADTGLYELRYMPQSGDTPLGRAAIEVIAAEVSLSAPDTTLTGAAFDVSWTGTVHPRDFVTIVPMGADDDASGNYFRTGGDDGTKSLKAPADTGLYEVRYVLDEGRRVMARTTIEVTEPEVTVSAPDTTLTGAAFDVSWTGTVHPRDFVTIVPMGADDDASGNYFRTGGDDGTKSLKAPADTGLYEVRYVLDEGRRVMARATIEVTEPEVTVSAPDTTLTGAAFDVSWTGTVHPRDFVTIVPMGADDDASGNYFRTGGADGTKSLKAPADTGLYEVRYVLDEGRRVMARTTIEVTEPEVTVSAPEQLRVGERLRVEWTGAVHPRDYVTLVPRGSPDDTSGQFKRVGNAARADLSAPDAPGLYELRYVLNEGRRVLARAPVEVLAEDAQLSTGATLQAPEAAAPGAVIEVSWTGGADSADQRITLARGDQAIFTWVLAKKIDGPPPLRLTLPDTPGLYELRFLDVSGQQVLSRAPIEIR
ncbi:VWA domain-containing protein [Aquicoccus porphyridii]|uniref:VWA domain-containing protein n=1 Tax=Aquicoccus porphyridii TaxID=1852029 RepID=A0A5A9YY91_9RHOB|nr:vWA domain-containing protein [Aquicoccus porphyridii]KAA0909818.1 VWA domain-containing protein [Aquicoccus porphyridii]